MRSSKVFLVWIFLASTATCLRPLKRWNFELEPKGALLNKRQDVSAIVGATTSLPTETAAPAATTDVQFTSEAIPTSSDTPTTDLTPTSAPASISQAPSSSISSAVQAPSSVPLLFTESASASTSQTPLTVVAAPTAVSDSNVPFFDSKYHQMIIALASLCGALLIAIIVLTVVVLRARADVDLLNDRLSRYEEGFDLPARKGEAGVGYGRLSVSDPDEMKSFRSRRTTGESVGSTLPLRHERRFSGTPAGNRSDASLPPKQTSHRMSSSSLGYPAHSPPAFQVAFPSSQHGVPPNRAMRQSSGPRPNPGTRRVSMVDNGMVVPQGTQPLQIRRLPNAQASNSSHHTRSNPFIGGPPAPY